MKAVKQFKFELAHRLVTSYSKKCQSMHGHSYLGEVVLEGEHLNDDGMVMDFGEVKDKLNFLFEAWDHSFMFYSKDPLAHFYKAMLQVTPLRLIEVDYNPTAENMAHHIFRACIELDLPVVEVRVQETKTGWATASRPKMFVGEDVTYYNIEEIQAQGGGRHYAEGVHNEV